MKEFDATALFAWIAQRLIYFAVILLLFLGSAFASIFSETQSTLPFYQRVTATIFSVSVMGLIVGYCISKYELNPYLMCMLAAFLGMGSDKVSQWLLSIWKNSDGFEDFAVRVGKIIFAVRRAIKDTEPSEEDQPAQPKP